MHPQTANATGAPLQLLLLLLMAAVLMQTAFGQKTTEDNEMSSRGRVIQERPGTWSDVRVQDMLREVMEQLGNMMYRMETLLKNSEEKLNEKLQSFERSTFDKLSAELDEKLERLSNVSRTSIDQLGSNLQATAHQQIHLLHQHNDSRQQIEKMGVELQGQIERNRMEFNSKLERHHDDMLTLVDRLKVELDQKLKQKSNLSHETAASIDNLERNLQSNVISLKATIDEQHTQLTHVQETMLQQHNDSRQQIEKMGLELQEQIERHRIEFNNKLNIYDGGMLTLVNRLKVDLDQKLERQSNLSHETVASISKLDRNIQSIVISLKATVDSQLTQLTNVQVTMLQQHNDSRQQIQQMGVALQGQIERHRIEFNVFCNKSQTCSLTSRPRDCADVMSQGHRTNGVYTVYVGGTQRPMDVYCDMTTDGGGWMVIQRRKDGCENFYRNWVDYATGFGNLNGEFWLGNDHLYSLTISKGQRLRIDLADFNDDTRYAEYSNFKVAPSCEKYKLISIGTYSGTAGDSLRWHDGQKFSTFDQDNDIHTGGSCAVLYKGAWWYSKCHSSNLNGFYLRGNHTSYADGVEWSSWTGAYYSLKFTEMKIRPADV